MGAVDGPDRRAATLIHVPEGDGQGRGDRPDQDEETRRLEWVESVYARTMSSGATKVEGMRQPPRGLGLSERTMERYIARVRARWTEESVSERPHRTDQHRTAILKRIVKAEVAGAWGFVASAHRLLAEIDGVRQPERHVHAIGDAGDLSKLGIDDLRELDRIRAKLDETAAAPKPNGNGGDVPKDEEDPENGEPGT